MRKIEPPISGEYAPYAIAYIDKVPKDGFVFEYLQQNFTILYNLISSLPEEKLAYRYAPGKWTLKEMMVHIIDAERIFGYRALCIARGEKAELPGFDENTYASVSNADQRPITGILKEYSTLRASTISLFQGFAEDAWLRLGVANHQPISVRALAYMIVGHELHHLSIIDERYL